MKDQTVQTPASQSKTRYLGGKGSVIEYRIVLDKLDTAKVQEVVKKGRIAEMTDPLTVVELDDKGRDGKTVEVAIKDVIKFVSPAIVKPAPALEDDDLSY